VIIIIHIKRSMLWLLSQQFRINSRLKDPCSHNLCLKSYRINLRALCKIRQILWSFLKIKIKPKNRWLSLKKSINQSLWLRNKYLTLTLSPNHLLSNTFKANSHKFHKQSFNLRLLKVTLKIPHLLAAERGYQWNQRELL